MGITRRLKVKFILLLIALVSIAVVSTTYLTNFSPVVSAEETTSNTSTPTPVPFSQGDIFVGSNNSNVYHYNSQGILLSTLDTQNTQTGSDSGVADVCFDNAGNLYAVNGGFSIEEQTIAQFSNRGSLLVSPWGNYTPFYGKSFYICISDGNNIYVGQTYSGPTSIIKFSTIDGSILDAFNLPTVIMYGTAYDVAPDKCTMLYIDYPNGGAKIKSYNICTKTQNPDITQTLPSQYCGRSLRIRQNGEVFVSCQADIYRISSSGMILKTYPISNPAYRYAPISLDPDNIHFWVGGVASGNVYKVDIDTGEGLTNTFFTIPAFNGTDHQINFLTVYGTFGTPLPPVACEVTTSPSMRTLTIGETASISASVTSGLGSASVTQIHFGSYNTTLATVNPSEDTVSPYETTVTAVAESTTAIWATADLSDGRTCESSGETDTDVSVLAPTPTPIPCSTSPSELNSCNSNLQKGDILLLHAVNPLSVSEALLFNGYWSHAGIYNGDGTITESYPLHDWPDETPGVVSSPAAQSLFWKEDIDDWAILRINSLDATKKGKAVEYAKNKANENRRYNYAFWDKETEEKFYCSQLVWRAFKNEDAGGIDLDSNYSAFSTFAKHWKTPLGIIGGVGILSAVPPDDIYFSPYVSKIEERSGTAFGRWVWRILSPAKLLVTDPQGKRTGYDPETNSVIQEIPSAFYGGLDSDPQFISYRGVIDDTWKFQAIGTDTGEYTFLAESVDKDTHPTSSASGNINPGQVVTYKISNPTDGEAPIQIQQQVQIKVIPHEIYPKAGIFAASILGATNFNVNDIDIQSIRVGKGNAQPIQNKGFIVDINRDKTKDLLTFYLTKKAGISPNDTQICLTGKTKAGQTFKGCDIIKVVSKPPTLLQFLKLIIISDAKISTQIQQFVSKIKE